MKERKDRWVWPGSWYSRIIILIPREIGSGVNEVDQWLRRGEEGYSVRKRRTRRVHKHQLLLLPHIEGRHGAVPPI